MVRLPLGWDKIRSDRRPEGASRPAACDTEPAEIAGNRQARRPDVTEPDPAGAAHDAETSPGSAKRSTVRHARPGTGAVSSRIA